MGSGTAEADSFNLSNQGELHPNEYYIIADFIAKDGVWISYEVISSYNMPLDVLVIEATYLDAYIAGPNFQYLPCSCLNDTQARITIGSGDLEIGKEYILLIDNSVDPIGGAIPNGVIQYSYSANLQNVGLPDTMETDTLVDFLIFMFMVGGMFTIFIVFVVVASRGRNVYRTVRLQSCPSCQSQVPEMNAICPKCGGNMR